MAQALITTAFNTVGVATKHEHWFKEAEEVEPIVGPLCRIIETMPASTLKAIEKRFNSIALIIGTSVVILPDVTEEVRLRKEEYAIRRQNEAKGTPPPARSYNGQGAATGGGGRVSPQPAGGNGATGRDIGWADTLPPQGLSVEY